MLIKLTSKCTMMCPHCMEDAQPTGLPMTLDTFKQAVKFGTYIGNSHFVLSGGEPTENDLIAEMCEWFDIATGCNFSIVSNGMWLKDERKRQQVEWITNMHSFVGMQVYTHRKWYKEYEYVVSHKHEYEKYKHVIVDIDDTIWMQDLGRAKTNKEAQQLVADWLKMIDERDITLFVVIHQNEGGESNKLRAFIGSELMRKASNILQVSVVAGCFEIEQTKSRSVPMPIYRIRIDGYGNLTQSMVENPQTEEGRLADIFGKVIGRRNGTFDSKKQIYSYIAAATGEGESRARKLYERADALDVIKVAYDGHKYKLSLVSGKLDSCSGE